MAEEKTDNIFGKIVGVQLGDYVTTTEYIGDALLKDVIEVLKEQARQTLDWSKHLDRTITFFKGPDYIGWRTGDCSGLDVISTETV